MCQKVARGWTIGERKGPYVPLYATPPKTAAPPVCTCAIVGTHLRGTDKTGGQKTGKTTEAIGPGQAQEARVEQLKASTQ